MIRLYTQHDLASGAALPLDEGQSRYLAAVMRLAVGDEVAVFNGRDGEWRATLASVGKRAVVLTALSQSRPQTVGPDVDLIVALVKRGPLETIIEKATELGVSRLRLVTTERTNADHMRLDRLRIIALEAAEQTGRLEVPQVAEPVKLERMLTDWDPGRRLMFCDEAGDALPVLEAVTVAGPWAILIGPEGGFSPKERDWLRALAFTTPVSLGPRILRADTAAISALTLWQAAVGDWHQG